MARRRQRTGGWRRRPGGWAGWLGFSTLTVGLYSHGGLGRAWPGWAAPGWLGWAAPGQRLGRADGWLSGRPMADFFSFLLFLISFSSSGK